MTTPDHAASREEFHAASLPGSWQLSPIPGLRVRELWSREGGISIALLSFDQGAGISRRHRHASNQFMYSLSGRYSYTSSGLELKPGDFYWNPMGNHHGPTEALEASVLLEIYDGPHYFDEPGES
jgi:2,4'-dihydroxyacetophenone dioxygenase